MKQGAEKMLKPSSGQVSVARSDDPNAPGLVVTVQPGEDGYPGVALVPPTPWDLSASGHVEARITNLGTQNLTVTLRVDGAGPWQDNPWNGSNTTIEPGKTALASTIFGYSWGNPGYALKPQAVTQVLLFTGKATEVTKFRIESIAAAGPAGEKPYVAPPSPDSKRIKPQGGVLFGANMKGVATQLTARNALPSLANNALRVTLPAGKDDLSATWKPEEGRWDLREALQVLVRVRNEGTTPVAPRLRVESNPGPTEWVASAPIPPGQEREIVIPFEPTIVRDLSKKETQGRFMNDVVSGVTIAADRADVERVLSIGSIRAGVPPTPALPAWLGKRPPIAGDWVQTLSDDFNGTKLNEVVWSVKGPNYWDKTSHWSRDNVILGGGVARLRYEKKTGFQDDDPTLKKSDYASGYLHTYEKWAQKFGYFEARMKMPKAPGLWPAFWMMPDRGLAAGPEQWKRQDTANGGMEFDILEHLTRWGPNRQNMAFHYDGYGKDHKHIGSDTVYIQPDKDGFITAGLLWTPGSAVYYLQGREVLRWDNPRISNVPQMLMFTLPMGGWDNSPLDDALLPDDFIVDYVRVWQRRDLASPTDGKQLPSPVAPPVAPPAVVAPVAAPVAVVATP